MTRQFCLFALLALPAFCQTHPYSNSWSYVASPVTSSAQLSATTVAGTGGTATHTMDTIAIYLESPALRTASASDYPSGTTGQATGYLSLCGGGVCENGTFFIASTGTTETCGTTGMTLYLAAQTASPSIQPWVQWLAVTPAPASIGTAWGSTVVTGTLQKSVHCGGVSSVSIGVTPNPPAIRTTYETPNTPTRGPVTFSGATGNLAWTVKTTAANTTAGTLNVGYGIESSACVILSGPLKSGTVPVI
jgi:hypothetical protein